MLLFCLDTGLDHPDHQLLHLILVEDIKHPLKEHTVNSAPAIVRHIIPPLCRPCPYGQAGTLCPAGDKYLVPGAGTPADSPGWGERFTVLGPVLDGRFVEDDADIVRPDARIAGKVPDDRLIERPLRTGTTPRHEGGLDQDRIGGSAGRHGKVLLFSLADPDPEGGLRCLQCIHESLAEAFDEQLPVFNGFSGADLNFYKGHGGQLQPDESPFSGMSALAAGDINVSLNSGVVSHSVVLFQLVRGILQDIQVLRAISPIFIVLYMKYILLNNVSINNLS